MPVKLTEIAGETGLCVATVSRILNGTTGSAFSSTTRKRVIAAAHSLGYRANGSARAVRAGRFSAVGLVSEMSGARSWATHRMLTAIEMALHAHDLHLILSALDYKVLTSDAYMPKILRELLVDGVLLNYGSGIPPHLVEMIETHNLPVIWLNTIRQHDCVYVNNYAGFFDATRGLIGAGHRRIAYLGHGVQGDCHYSMTDRLAGYEAAMRQAGLASQEIACAMPGGDAGALRSALSASERPTAILCYQSDLANLVLFHAARLGLSVPEDLSLLTMASEGDMSMPQRLSRLEVREAERAAAAVSALRQKISNPSVRLSPFVVALHLLDEGASVRSISR